MGNTVQYRYQDPAQAKQVRDMEHKIQNLQNLLNSESARAHAQQSHVESLERSIHTLQEFLIGGLMMTVLWVVWCNLERGIDTLQLFLFGGLMMTVLLLVWCSLERGIDTLQGFLFGGLMMAVLLLVWYSLDRGIDTLQGFLFGGLIMTVLLLVWYILQSRNEARRNHTH